MKIFEIRNFYIVGAYFLSTTKARIQEIWSFKNCHACMKMDLAIWFLILSIKTVNVMTGCESLHKLNRNFSFQIVWLQIESICFWLTFDSTGVYYINLVG